MLRVLSRSCQCNRIKLGMVYSKPDKGGLGIIDNEPGCPRSSSLSQLRDSIDKA